MTLKQFNEIKDSKSKKVKMEDIIEMRCYIKYNLYYGQPLPKIKQALIEQGWTEKEIDKEYNNIHKPENYRLKHTPKEEVNRKVVHNIPVQQAAKNIVIPKQPQQEIKEEEIPVPLPPQARR